MPNTADFIAHVLELMRPTARAFTRSMFGGHGVYVDGKIVAIVINDELYLKTDETTRPAFLDRDLGPFRYSRQGRDTYAMSYHRAPDEALESPDAMREWLQPALGVALRASVAKGRKATAEGTTKSRPKKVTRRAGKTEA